jgi:hypothetical protein
LEAEEIFARFFLIAFLNSPCHETPKNAIKKNRTKQPEEKKNGGEKSRIFCDEPRQVGDQSVNRQDLVF